MFLGVPPPSPRFRTPLLAPTVPHHVLCGNGGKAAHGLEVLLLAHDGVRLAHVGQHLEIVNVKRRREGVEKLCFFICRVGKRVWRANRHRNVVANMGIVFSAVWSVELVRLALVWRAAE